MKTETYVSIPQPCHEKWDVMTPQDKGRFCASCEKTVVDFSQMSDTQVLQYLSHAQGRLCGRFAQEQLERPLIELKKAKNKIWWMAALMPLTLLINKATAQKITKADVTTHKQYEETMGLVATKMLKQKAMVDSNKTISGTIVSSDSIPINVATVVLKGTTIGTVTDNSGKFHLSFGSNDSSVKIIVSAIGYDEKEINCSFNNTNEVNISIEPLSLMPVLAGEVVIVGAYRPYRPIKKLDTIKTVVRKIFKTNPFKVYPNPVSGGAAIYIEVKNEGHYSIQLLDVNSKLITNTLFDAVKGAYTTSLIIPSSAAAGVYFIRLINDDTKQQYTDKIIVH